MAEIKALRANGDGQKDGQKDGQTDRKNQVLGVLRLQKVSRRFYSLFCLLLTENRNTKLGSAGRFAQRIPAGVWRIPTESVGFLQKDVRRMSRGRP